MKINESKRGELHLAERVLKGAQQSVSFLEENLNTLNTDKDQEVEVRAGSYFDNPVTRLLHENEKISADEKDLTHQNVSERSKDTMKKYSLKRAKTIKGMKEKAVKDSVVQRKEAGGAVNAYTNTFVGEAAKARTRITASTAVNSAAGTMTGAATGAATGGASLAVQSVKTMKDALAAKQAAASAQIGQLKEKMEAIRSSNSAPEGIRQTLTYAGATTAVILLVMLQAAVSVMVGLVGILLSIFISLTIVVTVITAVISFVIALVSTDQTAGAERIVQVALSQENITDGTKYWQYTMGSRFVNGSATPWCACFVSWCANECGYIDDGIFPKSGAVRSYRKFYEDKGLYHNKEGYVPKTGDLIIFNPSHIGIVQYVEGGYVITIEGNTSDAVHTRSYPLNSSYIVGYCTPEYPGEASIMIPDGMGTYHTYMGWHTITSTTSRQYQLREQSGENYDEEGFARIDGRYVIACTTTFGEVGDYIDFYRENGDVIHAVIGDIKNQNDAGCNEYGHADGRCVVEFIVSRSWYPSHPNPGTSGCHPEWRSRVVEVVNLGKNYFD